MGALIKVSGIIISAAATRAKATMLRIQCRKCRQSTKDLPIAYGLSGAVLPRKCARCGGMAGALMNAGSDRVPKRTIAALTRTSFSLTSARGLTSRWG